MPGNRYNGAEPSNDYGTDNKVETSEARMSTARASHSETPGVGGRTALSPDHRDPALNHVRPEEGDTGRTPLRGAVRIKGKAVTWKNPTAGLIACPTPRARKWTIPEPSFLATQWLRISLIQN